MYTLGIDIGSTATKAVVLKNGKDIYASAIISFGAVPCQGWKMSLNVGGVVCNVLLFACRKQPAMPQSMVSRYSPLPSPLPAGKVSTRLIWQVVALPLSIPAPSSGNRTGEKEDYKIAEINFLKSMTSTINNIAVASSVCGGLKRKNKNIRSQLIFLHQ